MIPHPTPSLSARSSLAAGAACLVGALALLAGATASAASTDPSDPEPTVSFARPADGARIAGVVDVAMIAEGVDIEPAGEAHAGAGHFHIMIDAACVEPGNGIPRDDAHLHFGKGQTEAQLYLAPGTHTLCLQVGDGIHTAQAITDQISIEVGIESIEQFCTVATQLDGLTDDHMDVSADMSDDDFVAAQQVAADALHLVDQLRDALSLVPETARPDVDTATAALAKLAGIVTTSEDADAAVSQLDEDDLWATDGDALLRTARWLEDTCALELTKD